MYKPEPDIQLQPHEERRDGIHAFNSIQTKWGRAPLDLLYTVENSPFQGQVFVCGVISIYSLKQDFVKDGNFELICSIDRADIGTMGVPKSFGLQSWIGTLLENSEAADVTFELVFYMP